MRLIVGWHFDGEVFPGPLAEAAAAGRPAVAGERWVGPMGLLGILETMLGLGGLYLPDVARAAGIVTAVQQTQGFWSASAKQAPLPVARRLLEWRDRLWLQGWHGQPLTPRLAGLAEVCVGLPERFPGLPDRLAAIARALESQIVPIAQIELAEYVDDYPPAWRQVFQLLQSRCATRLVHFNPPAPESAGDLAAARGTGFAPAGDGSLQLLRPAGPLEAAEQVAAWLASQGEDALQTVLVTPDATLDLALARHGLPTCGAAAVADGALLQVLPLVLACGWDPPDPERVLELLTLPVSPVPPGIGGRLLAALQEWPAVGSTGWGEALASGLEAIPEEASRARVRERLEKLFTPCASRTQPYPASEILARLRLLRQWGQGRLQVAADNPAPWAALLNQLGNMERIVGLAGLAGFTPPQLQSMIEGATADSPRPALLPAQAGLRGCASPGALAGPARRVVWWMFEAGTAPGVRSLPLTSGEWQTLARAGIPVPDPGHEMMTQARAWARPLRYAAQSLLLVCPRRGYDGQPLYPHPLWDEITARLAEGARADLLLRAEPASPALVRTARPLAPPPRPRRHWNAPPVRLPRRPRESPRSLATLLRCPFQYVAQYLGGLWRGRTASLESDEDKTLLGKVAHHVIACFLAEAATLATPDDAEQRVLELFEREAPRLAAPLFLAGGEYSRKRVQRAVVAAARLYWQLLHEYGLGVLAVERECAGQVLGVPFEGTPDVVLGAGGQAPRLLLDMKWSGEKYRRAALEQASDLQLAAYSFLAGAGQAWPAVGFLILDRCRILTTDDAAWPATLNVSGPAPEQVWTEAVRAAGQALVTLGQGRLTAAGIAGDAAAQAAGGDDPSDCLSLEPECGFCPLGALCGQIFSESA